uniref:Uncharacterized protein n=1 Tax=Setaria viridis TaxID=4556 RepID=A0A4U6WEL7_SETVI|nr:hypothetical protein SEVIR_1G246100v2 [Setaria viridis]
MIIITLDWTSLLGFQLLLKTVGTGEARAFLRIK